MIKALENVIGGFFTTILEGLALFLGYGNIITL